MLTITRTDDGRTLCNECFNALSESERNGMGARPAGWVPPGTTELQCEVCERNAYDLENTEST